MPAETKFDGFGKEGVPFLKALGFHQNREWFHENKKLYESQLREPLVALVEHMSERLETLPVPLKGSRKSSLFRINRDVRFSKEKHPYNTHVSAVLTRTGDKKDTGGVYMHFAPDGNDFGGETGSFLGSGLWFPPSPKLKAMRQRIVSHYSEFQQIVADLADNGLEIGHDQMLTRPPQGFKHVDDPEQMEWLKHKMFIVSKPIKDTRLTSPKLADDIEEFAKAVMPLMQFVWRAIDPLREEEGNA
ncbi:MAG: TIGR02453 family protein [Pseudomonadota bacterium]